MLFLVWGKELHSNLKYFFKSATAKIFTLTRHLVKQGDERTLLPMQLLAVQ